MIQSYSPNIAENLHMQLKTRLDSSLEEIGMSENFVSNAYTWYNNTYHSPTVRYGHLEYFKDESDKIEMVHCLMFPNYYKGIPVFGLDIIHEAGKAVEIFCDFTPSPFNISELEKQIGQVHEETKYFKNSLNKRSEFFSKNCISLVVDEGSYCGIEDKCIALLDCYLSFCSKNEFDGRCLNKQDATVSVSGQNKYSVNQRLNAFSQKALAKYIGIEKTKNFVNLTLFPVFKA